MAPFSVKQIESKSHKNPERVPSRETVLKPADTLFRQKSTLKGLSYISYCNEMIMKNLKMKDTSPRGQNSRLS